MKKKVLKLLVGSVTAAATIGGLAACTRQEAKTETKQATNTKVNPTPEVKEGLTGEYYSVDGTNFTFTSIGNSFILNVGQTYTGTIEKNGSKYDLKINEGSLTAQAEVVGDVVKITFNGKTYELNVKKNYTVKYMDGDKAVFTDTVVTGDFANEYGAPEKAGYEFIGWYQDKDLTTLFDFDQAITSDVTVYAKYLEVKAGVSEYTVQFFDEDGFVIEQATTVGGVVAILPTPRSQSGAKFVGWYLSATNEADKLTAKYEGQALTADTNLYAVFETGAPVISIANNVISWTSVGMNANYVITITSPNGDEAEFRENKLSMEFDFENSDMGEYMVTVSANGKSSTAYYLNKALDRVSQFEVVESKYLIFNPVDKATSYKISVSCGNDYHNHEYVELGTNTFYDFSGCEMTAEGITFTVYAYAKGYMESVAEYTYKKELDEISKIEYNEETADVVWSRVKNAISYDVTVTDNSDNFTFTINVGNTTTYNLSSFTGDLTVSVTPKTPGYYGVSAVLDINKTNLPAPYYIDLNGNKLEWENIANAKSYVVMINDKQYQAETNSLALDLSMLEENVTDYTVRIMAVAEDAKNNSTFSVAKTFKYLAMPENISYKNGIVSWDAVIGAARYGVKVNGGKIQNIFTNEYPVAFNKEGYNEISVCFYDEFGNESDFVTINVFVTTVTYFTEGGSEVDKEYYAVSDNVYFPETLKTGYEVQGWYNIPNGGKNNGIKYEEGFVIGATPVILYAYWTPAPFEVELILGDTGDFEEVEPGVKPSTDQTLYYSLDFTLPVPKSNNELFYFEGWYLEPNGVGVKYADMEGNSVRNWDKAENGIKLYAYWASVLVDYEEIKDATGNVVSYRANASANIALGETVRIESTYKGKPVTEIGSFASSSKMVTLQIPDTIQFIPYDTAFKSCTSLLAFEVYHVEGNAEIKFASDNGVLYQYNDVSTNKGWEVIAFPYKKDGEYKFMEGTVNIPSAIMKSSKLTKVIIPYTVNTIGEQAFYLSSSLTEIEFEATPAGETPVPLTVAKEAFRSCTKLESFKVPARLKSFDETVFDACKALKTISVEEGSSLFVESNGMLAANVGGVKTIVFCPKGREGELTLENDILAIGTGAFKSCTLLTKITIPQNVTAIAASAFEGCTAVEQVVIEDNPDADDAYKLSIADKAFYGLTAITEVTIPSNVKSIGVAAFGKTSKLTTVNLYATTENIATTFANGAFADISTTNTLSSGYVTTVNIGKDVHAFDIVGVFNGSNNKLTTINVDDANPYYKVEEDVLYDKDMKNLIFYPANKQGAFVVPESVETIAAGAFRNKLNITGVTIGKNVKNIGENAFYYCQNLTSIVIEDTPDGEEVVELTIEDGAFYYCDKNTVLNLPTRLRKIGRQAFGFGKALTEITVPEGVVELGTEAFRSCTSVTTVNLPSTLTDIYYYNTKNKKDAKYDATTTDDFSTFAYCSNLNVFNIAEANPVFAGANGILYLKEDNVIRKLCYCPLGKSGSVVVPSTVNMIGAKAFYNNPNITSISFENDKSAITYNGTDEVVGTLTVGTNAFYYCTSLVSADLPNLSVIPEKLFYNCKALKSFKVPYTVTKINIQSFYNTTSLTTLEFEATPEGVTPVDLEIGTATISSGSSGISSTTAPFAYSGIKELVLPERLTKIGDYAFYGYGSYESSKYYFSNLKKVVLPSTLTTIGKYAFYQNDYLEEVEFKDNQNITAIGDYAFSNCNKITSLTLPTGAAAGYTIGTYSFSSLKKLANLTIPQNVKSIGNNAFQYLESLENITFEAGNDADKSKLETIGNYAFAYDRKLKAVTIPVNVKSVGNDAFYQDNDLATVGFAGEKINTIGEYAFAYTALTEFTYPVYKVNGNITAFTKIGNSMFQGCPSLETINLGDSVKTVVEGSSNYSVFRDCKSIKTITVGENNENMKVDSTGNIIVNKNETNILYFFGHLAEELNGIYDLSQTNIDTISSGAFSGDTGIVELTLPKTLKWVGAYAFNEAPGLKKVIFSQAEDAEEVAFGQRIFNNCKKLEEVTLPKVIHYTTNGTSVTAANKNYLAQYMFYHCDSLKAIEIPESVVTIGNYALAYAGIENLVIPNSVVTINPYAFQYCSKLKSVTLPTASTFTALGNYSFGYCSALEEVVIPDNVKTSGQNTFRECSSLRSITLSSQITKLDNSFLYGTKSLKTIDFKNVTELGTSVFEKGGLEEINIPETLIKIGNSSFASTNLTNVYLPETLESIGTGLFKGCLKLATATVDSYSSTAKFNGILSDSMFENCPVLYEVTLNNNIKYIGKQAFFQDKALRYIDLPSDLLVIGQKTFGESGLVEIDIPKSIIAIGGTTYTASALTGTSASEVFKDCKNLTKVTIEEGTAIQKLNSSIFAGCDKLTDFVIPATVNTLGANAFQDTKIKSFDLSHLTSTSLPGSLFKNNTEIESITIPNTVKTLGSNMFEGCTKLSDVKLSSILTTINASTFAGCTSLEKIAIPNTLTSLSTSAFAGSAIKNITLPASLKTIGKQAFSNCEFLEEVNLGSATTTINEAAFENTVALKEIIIPSTVTSIGKFAFKNSGLTGTVTLYSTIKTFGANPFADCANLDEIELSSAYGGNTLTIIDKVIYNGSNIVYYPNSLGNQDFTVPEGCGIGAYAFSGVKINTLTLASDAAKIGDYALGGINCDNIVIPEGVTSIGQYAFDGCSATSIVLPDALDTLSTRAFSNSNFINVTLPNNFEELPTYLFTGSKKLESVTFGDKLTKFNTYTFQDCESLTSVIAPSLTEVGNYSFQNTGFTEVTIVPTIAYGTYAYANCANLTKVNVAEGANSLANYMFDGCEALATVTLPEGFEKIGNYVFRNCKALTNISLPQSFNYLGSYAFSASGITSIVLPKGLDRIYSYAFLDCADLTSVEFEDGSIMNYLDSNCFQNCTSIQSIYIPATVAKIYYSFTGWTNAQTVYFEMPEEEFLLIINSTWRESGSYTTNANFEFGVTKQ